MTSAGSTADFVDSSLENADDYYNGWWAWFTSGTNDEEERPVDDYAGSTVTGTIRGDALASTADGDTYELWKPDMRPSKVHRFINRAIRAVPRKASPPSTSYAFHTGGHIRSFDIPTALVGISEVHYRSWIKSTEIHACDTAFDESVTASVTVTADDEDFKRGAAANRISVAASVGTGLLASDDISSLDLSGYTHVEFWVKSTIATAAGNLKLRLSSTANAGTATDDLSIPALTANTWTFVRVALANPHLDTAIISVGLRQDTDIGAAYIWLDDIQAVRDDSGAWEKIHRDLWWIEQDERELVLSEEAIGAAPYNLLKVVGAKKPTELTADATSCDVEPEYIIAKATALAIRARGEPGISGRGSTTEADRWEALAQQALGRIQTPQGMRWVSD